jgi:hypothetical protein
MTRIAPHIFKFGVRSAAKRRRTKFGLGGKNLPIPCVGEHPSRPRPDVQGLQADLAEGIQDRQKQQSADDTHDRAADGRRLIFPGHCRIVREAAAASSRFYSVCLTEIINLDPT